MRNNSATLSPGASLAKAGVPAQPLRAAAGQPPLTGCQTFVLPPPAQESGLIRDFDNFELMEELSRSEFQGFP